MRKYRMVRKRTRGGSLKTFLSRAHDFLKKHKIVSGILKGYSSFPLPFSSQAGMFGKAADVMGYGRRRRGGALKSAGGALRAAGMRRRCGGMVSMAQ